jgi:hypothetical protein
MVSFHPDDFNEVVTMDPALYYMIVSIGTKFSKFEGGGGFKKLLEALKKNYA